VELQHLDAEAARLLVERVGEARIVRPPRFAYMGIVPGVGQVELADELGLDRSNVANVVDRLVRRGL
jgi:DNA-binding MarR family transcriptional regulator